MKGISNKYHIADLRELEKDGILVRQAQNEISPPVEDKQIKTGQELV